MKKLLTILLIAFFAVGFSSCAEESFDTEPVMPEVSQEAIDKVRDQNPSTRRPTQRTNSTNRNNTRKGVGDISRG